jgi:hypothetical protein
MRLPISSRLVVIPAARIQPETMSLASRIA